MWTEMARYRTGAPDGGTEELVLEKDENGNFRIRMSGYEFFRKISRDVENDLEDELNELWTGVDFNDVGSDCSSDDYTGSIAGPDFDSNGYGAD